MRLRTQLSIDLPARYVFVIGVEGWLDAVSGVRLLRLLDTRLTLTSAAARPTRRVLIDLTNLDSLGQRWRQVAGPGSPHCRVPRCHPGPYH